jgi:hypothetical protein
VKGKYAARAALRREDDGVRSEIESYQHAIRQLTGERDQLRSDLAALRAAHKDETRKLRAMLDEGLSPELLALREELERQRQRTSQAEASCRTAARDYDRVFNFTAKLLHDLTGCTGLEAAEAIVNALGASSRMVTGPGTGPSVPEGEATVATIQRIRGYRSSAKVIDHLNAVCKSAAQKPRSTADRKMDRWRDA